MFKKSVVLCFVLLMGGVSRCFAQEGTLFSLGNDIIVEHGIEVDTAVSVGGDVKIYGHVRQNAVSIGGSVFLSRNAQTIASKTPMK